MKRRSIIRSVPISIVNVFIEEGLIREEVKFGSISKTSRQDT